MALSRSEPWPLSELYLLPNALVMPPLQELYGQLKAKEDVYSQLLAKGRLMLLNRDDSGSGSKTEQSVALLEQKWCLVSTKMEERKVALASTLAP